MSTFPDPAALAGLSAALIRISSMPGQEADLAGFLRGWLAERGVQAWTDPAGNLLAFVAGREPGPGWMLLTHLDHVSVGDESLWTHPPFSGVVEETEDGPIVHGRGAVDIKGPLAAHAVLLANLAANPARRGVLLVAAAEEETTGAGATALTADWPPTRPDGTAVEVGAVIVAEPSNNRVMLGHRGILRLVVSLHGRAHHASFARSAENPFFALGELLRRLEARRPLPDPVLGEDSIVPTLVGVDSTSANVTPNTVVLTLDWRTVSADRSVLQRELDALTRGLDATAEVPEPWTQTAIGYHSPGFVVAPDAPLAGMLVQAADRARGFGLPAGVWRFATDGRFTARIGVPTIGFGPGDPALAHTTVERVPVAELALHARALAGLVADGVPPA